MTDRSTSPMRTLAHAVILGAGMTSANAATARPELSEAFGRWFATDPTVTCVDSSGRDRRCSISGTEHIDVHRDPTGTHALVFVTYLPDPTGNAEETAAAVFRHGPDGWRLERRLPGIRTKPAGLVTFRDGVVQFAVEVLKPGDARCCPTGRKPVRVTIR